MHETMRQILNCFSDRVCIKKRIHNRNYFEAWPFSSFIYVQTLIQRYKHTWTIIHNHIDIHRRDSHTRQFSCEEILAFFEKYWRINGFTSVFSFLNSKLASIYSHSSYDEKTSMKCSKRFQLDWDTLATSMLWHFWKKQQKSRQNHGIKYIYL